MHSVAHDAGSISAAGTAGEEDYELVIMCVSTPHPAPDYLVMQLPHQLAANTNFCDAVPRTMLPRRTSY